MMITRRNFLKLSAATTSAAAVGDIGFLAQLKPVSAAEAKIDPAMVRLHSEIEPLVRLLEETPRDRVLEAVAARVTHGLSYRELVAAIMLAGVRNIQPRPVGFKFHAVLVVNSAHLASLASADAERWLPIFWAIDQFKASQAADVREGNWTMPEIDEGALPPSHRAKEAFVQAMDNWDEAAADLAIARLARTASAHELFEIFCRYGMRDFRDIGHKAIYVANSFRTLEVAGWQHAEPILRSLAYALLDRGGTTENPAKADLSPDRPFRQNREIANGLRSDWLGGQRDAGATRELLIAARTASPSEMSEQAVQLLNRGTAPQSIFEAMFDATGELLMRAPGIVSLHAVTTSNALHYAFQHCRDDETRRLLLLQNASFLPLFRGHPKENGAQIDVLEPIAVKASGADAAAEIFADVSGDKMLAARKILGYLQNEPDPRPLMEQARRLIFLKGTNSHDYKFSSAVLEDCYHLAPPWRDRFLAASAFQLRGSGAPDNNLVQRIRSALET